MFCYIFVSVLLMTYLLFYIKTKYKYIFLAIVFVGLFLAFPLVKKIIVSYDNFDRAINKFTGISSIKFSKEGAVSDEGSVERRWNQLKDAVRDFKAHPFVGTGRGTFVLLHDYHAHNNFIQMFAETGLLGGIAFIFLVMVTFKYLITGYRHFDNKIFWFCMLNSFFVTITLFAVECYIYVKLFWFFIVPFASYAQFTKSRNKKKELCDFDRKTLLISKNFKLD